VALESILVVILLAPAEEVALAKPEILTPMVKVEMEPHRLLQVLL
jgi:hypothetical protein